MLTNINSSKTANSTKNTIQAKYNIENDYSATVHGKGFFSVTGSWLNELTPRVDNLRLPESVLSSWGTKVPCEPDLVLYELAVAA